MTALLYNVSFRTGIHTHSQNDIYIPKSKCLWYKATVKLLSRKRCTFRSINKIGPNSHNTNTIFLLICFCILCLSDSFLGSITLQFLETGNSLLRVKYFSFKLITQSLVACKWLSRTPLVEFFFMRTRMDINLIGYEHHTTGPIT